MLIIAPRPTSGERRMSQSAGRQPCCASRSPVAAREGRMALRLWAKVAAASSSPTASGLSNCRATIVGQSCAARFLERSRQKASPKPLVGIEPREESLDECGIRARRTRVRTERSRDAAIALPCRPEQPRTPGASVAAATARARPSASASRARSSCASSMRHRRKRPVALEDDVDRVRHDLAHAGQQRVDGVGHVVQMVVDAPNLSS